jgi:hypothetical protein
MSWLPGPAMESAPDDGGGSSSQVSSVGQPRLAMPARRSGWGRVQLNTRVRVEVEQLLQRFVDDNDTTVQSSVDLALVEFLAARGYPLSAPGER